jgi:hypothetical protein
MRSLRRASAATERETNRADTMMKLCSRGEFSSLSLLMLLMLVAGCNVIGAAAQALPPDQIQPQYAGLAGQSVAVMVWTDPGVRVDWPSLTLDINNAVQSELEKAAAVKKPPKELLGTTFPLRPASVVRFQKDNPGLDALPITDVAPRLGVTRLLYLEVEEFSTRSAMAASLFRGSITGTMRIVEINDGQAKVVYEENNISAIFPPKSPEEGVLNANDYSIYLGTLRAFTERVIDRLRPHEERR